MSRARFLRLAGAVALGLAAPRVPAAPSLLTRPVPADGSPLPVIGCGTYIGFDVARPSAEYDALGEVVRTLFAAGGTVLDSSPMYGRAEAVTGRLLAEAGLRRRAFVATKVWTSGRAAGLTQMQASLRQLGGERIDLMQIHNLLDWRTHLPVLREWQAAGRIRYVGISHYTASAYDEVEAVLRAERLDFLQINYALDDRQAAQRLLPLAADRGVAVLVNRPFGGGGLLRRLAGRPLPSWAADIGATSWAQVLLKFVLSHPAVTCAIPGTGRAAHMRDNLAAGMAAPPPLSFWNDKA
ncbi:aldo/keto reductase [Bordetella bronchiseptica]|uniref:aldo/keto reductase n=1 Tax=Bordetella bronchiseptica TaxID=518 RepID=UPI0004593B1D|nr:aldo/keto reductase [Bordetella bronchiseptica]KAK54781.1 oxidoreductase, aldo/keto reductase family protein [Bordetella bronchiseptica OSU054]KDB78885.1 oxidoreductase, aldo/keto reductase family protein [Bordetella bronchiseptica CA90 BB1334]KDD47373.1 oxidoreductase, aldo/keto reductase family protein [Bordetella bronchiseptica OSU095]KDD89550.1 oxidoreductase, aldo/keto reductase family protein [Bordetella bronchiseptica MO275]